MGGGGSDSWGTAAIFRGSRYLPGVGGVRGGDGTSCVCFPGAARGILVGRDSPSKGDAAASSIFPRPFDSLPLCLPFLPQGLIHSPPASGLGSLPSCLSLLVTPPLRNLRTLSLLVTSPLCLPFLPQALVPCLHASAFSSVPPSGLSGISGPSREKSSPQASQAWVTRAEGGCHQGVGSSSLISLLPFPARIPSPLCSSSLPASSYHAHRADCPDGESGRWGRFWVRQHTHAPRLRSVRGRGAEEEVRAVADAAL